MQAEMLDVLLAIDALWDEEPSQHHLSCHSVWPLPLTTFVHHAARYILEGVWLHWMGRWFPENAMSFVWDGTTYNGTEDEPIGYQLLDFGVQSRSRGCLLASVHAEPQQISALRGELQSVPPASEQEGRFREEVLRWMEALYTQRHFDRDCFDQLLPTTIKDLTGEFLQSSPYRKQGNTSVVTLISLGKQVYFLKRQLEPVESLMTFYPIFQTECAVGATLRALPWQFGPHTTCLFVAADGILTYLSSKVSGVAMVDIRKAATRVSLASVQAAVLAEYLVGGEDRHFQNAFIDRFHAQPWLIDFANAFVDEPDVLELPDPAMPLDDQREVFMRALWMWHPNVLRTSAGETVILENVLSGLLNAEGNVMTTVRPYGLPDEQISVLQRRFAWLHRLASLSEQPTLERLNRMVLA